MDPPYFVSGLKKENQSVWICGDFKTTMDPVLKVDLPRIEDIFDWQPKVE